MKSNLNDLAKSITEMEGGKVECSIAQVKEVLKCVMVLLYAMETSELMDFLQKCRRRGREYFNKYKS